MRKIVFALCMLTGITAHADIVSQDANGQISVTTGKMLNLCVDSPSAACGTIKAGVGVSGNTGIGTTTPDRTLSVGGGANFKIATSTFGVGGLIGSVDFTQVTNTTTITSGTGNLTVFSTITVAANTLARNGDALVMSFYGTHSGIAEVRTHVIKFGSTVISSRTVSVGVSGAVEAWSAEVRLVRTSAGNQIRVCGLTLNTLSCTSTVAAPPIGAGVNTIDETQSANVTFSADGVTAGSTSFLHSNIMYIPGP